MKLQTIFFHKQKYEKWLYMCIFIIFNFVFHSLVITEHKPLVGTISSSCFFFFLRVSLAGNFPSRGELVDYVLKEHLIAKDNYLYRYVITNDMCNYSDMCVEVT